jgi:dihydroorotase-like cyclic amidohydrolase
MEKRSWWQRSLNGRLRSLKAKSLCATKPRRRIEARTKPSEGAWESITVVDLVERRRIAKELAWKSKWNTRRAKLDACSKKHR